MAYSTLARLSAAERAKRLEQNRAKAAHMRECAKKKREQAKHDGITGAGTALSHLNPRQKMFVIHYCKNGFNATEAAIQAGYPPAWASSSGSVLKSDKRIDAAVQERLRGVIAGPSELLARANEIAMANGMHLYNPDGSIDFQKLRDKGYLVKEYEPAEAGRAAKFKLHDQASMLVTLMKVNGLLTEKQEITGTGGGAIQHEVLTLTAEQAASVLPKKVEEKK
jgi:hypothetical protein